MLDIKDIQAGYGKKRVLNNVSLNVKHNEIVAIIGPNGAGKSTMLKVICGLIPIWGGEIIFDDVHISDSSPAKNVSRGITLCPQGNRVFDKLSVIENLRIGGIHLHPRELKEQIGQILQIFPILKDRLRQNAGTLSGGEQQTLALCRSLIAKPKLLMLDEPSLGLSPYLVRTVFEKIVDINRENKLSILVVEQKVRDVLEICNRVYSMKLGRVAFEGRPEELREDRAKLKDLFL